MPEIKKGKGDKKQSSTTDGEVLFKISLGKLLPGGKEGVYVAQRKTRTETGLLS